jgi:hypothetical protein
MKNENLGNLEHLSFLAGNTGMATPDVSQNQPPQNQHEAEEERRRREQIMIFFVPELLEILANFPILVAHRTVCA